MSRLHLDIHRDDTVQVMSGKDRGKRGVVVRTVPASGKIVVKGVNVLKRHRKANQEKGGTKVIERDARLQQVRQAHPDSQDGAAER
jgi:large subunit ribosomal protein L24